MVLFFLLGLGDEEDDRRNLSYLVTFVGFRVRGSGNYWIEAMACDTVRDWIFDRRPGFVLRPTSNRLSVHY